MQNNKLIFSDIDGTLTEFDTGIIYESALRTIDTLVQNGNQVFLCTGRSKQDIEDALFNLPFSGYILACGAHILYQGKTIYTQCLETDVLQALIHRFLEHKIGFVLEGLERNYLFGKAIDIYLQWEKINPSQSQLTIEQVLNNLEQRNTYLFDKLSPDDLKQIVKISFYAETYQYTLIENILNCVSHCFEYTLDQNKSLSVFGEITSKGCTKASGMIQILNYLNASLENTIAIGDGINDIPMIQTAHVGIAMGNAHDKLKECSDIITKSVTDNGFEAAFQLLNLI